MAGSRALDGQSNSSQNQPRFGVNTAQRQAKAGRGRPRDAAADKAILRAALELFIEHGIEGASFEQIARRAGVARTTVYRRWSGREWHSKVGCCYLSGLFVGRGQRPWP